MSDIKSVNQVIPVPIEKLKEWDRNPRVNDHAVQAVADSIRKFGMSQPVTINEQFEVMAGNTRVKAAKLLGMTHVPCVMNNWLDRKHQEAYNIADNKVGEIAYWDHDLLKEKLTELNQQEIHPTDLGYTADEAITILDGWGGNSARVDGINESDSPAPGKIVIECEAADENDLKEFLKLKISESRYKVVFK